jgi:hypothetical protein
VLDDTQRIATAYRAFRSQGSAPQGEVSTFSVPVAEIRAQAGKRLDAWYYDPLKNDVVKQIWDRAATDDGFDEVRALGDLIVESSDVFYPGRHKRNYCPPGPDAVPFLSGTKHPRGTGLRREVATAFVSSGSVDPCERRIDLGHTIWVGRPRRVCGQPSHRL